MGKIYNWGILGPGKIAHHFVKDLLKTEQGNLHAVASRSLDRAQTFADEYSAAHAYGSYEAMLECPDLDIIYVATPHAMHHEHTLLCLNAKIPVLCEKAFAGNRHQVTEMMMTALRKDVFLMEALWTRFLPSFIKTKELLDNQLIGTPISLTADFGFKADFDPKGRLFNKELAGGALLDIGIYPVLCALFLFGKPDKITANAHIGKTGVDEEISMGFHYSNGKMAHLHATLRATTPCEAIIYGEAGHIKIDSRWHESKSLSVHYLNDRPSEAFQYEDDVKGYKYEIDHVHECLSKGLKQSPIISLHFSTLLIQTLDRIRETIGLTYPFDQSKDLR